MGIYYIIYIYIYIYIYTQTRNKLLILFTDKQGGAARHVTVYV